MHSTLVKNGKYHPSPQKWHQYHPSPSQNDINPLLFSFLFYQTSIQFPSFSCENYVLEAVLLTEYCILLCNSSSQINFQRCDFLSFRINFKNCKQSLPAIQDILGPVEQSLEKVLLSTGKKLCTSICRVFNL